MQDKEAKEDEVEWLDYKEEQEKDYSGLKLRQLAEALPEPEEDTDDNHQEDQTPVEPAWKAVDAVPQPAPAVSAAKNNDEANKSVYISPALRNAVSGHVTRHLSVQDNSHPLSFPSRLSWRPLNSAKSQKRLLI